jgi:hypothetical protein
MKQREQNIVTTTFFLSGETEMKLILQTARISWREMDQSAIFSTPPVNAEIKTIAWLRMPKLHEATFVRDGE